jgi:hypothetical protein
MPGKVSQRIERIQLPSGQIVEIRRTERFVLERGIWQKEIVFEVVPPLLDCRTPESVAEIRECHVCIGAYHQDSVSQCIVCGHDYCGFRECSGLLKLPSGEKIVVCKPCADEGNMGAVKRLSRKFWQLGS